MKIKRLKALRIKNNLTQKEIAEVLDIKRSTYAGWELGTNIITLRKLVMLSNFYKSSIDYIVGMTLCNRYVSDIKIDLHTIGNNLKSIRINNKKTQKEIAIFLKISVSSYTLYELGKILIPTKFIYKIAKKFNCSIDYILTKK